MVYHTVIENFESEKFRTLLVHYTFVVGRFGNCEFVDNFVKLDTLDYCTDMMQAGFVKREHCKIHRQMRMI